MLMRTLRDYWFANMFVNVHKKHYETINVRIMFTNFFVKYTLMNNLLYVISKLTYYSQLKAKIADTIAIYVKLTKIISSHSQLLQYIS